MRLRFALAVVSILAGPVVGQESRTANASGFLGQEYQDESGVHRYVLFVPPSCDPKRPSPLIVFLNGAGECGVDGWKQVSVGLGTAIMDDIDAWPFLVLFPQKPSMSTQWEDHDAMVMGMLDATCKDFAVDKSRVYLTGLSQGGHGTYVLGARHHELWAGIAPLCGYGDPAALAPALAGVPMWCFHGEADKAVSVDQSKRIVEAVRAAGGHPHLSLYPGVGHNCWDKVYRTEALAAWFAVLRDQPQLADFLADADGITHAHLALSAGSAKGGVTELVFDFTDKDGVLAITTVDAEGNATTPRTVHLEHALAHRTIAGIVRDLGRAGVFRCKDAPPGAAAIEVRLDLAADDRQAAFRCRVDRASSAPRAQSGLSALMRQLEALH